MKLIAGMASPSDENSIINWPAPANGHYENMSIQVLQSVDEPISVYVGTESPHVDLSLEVGDGLQVFADRGKNGVFLNTFEVLLLAGANAAQGYYKHMAGKRIKVRKDDIVNMVLNSDAALTGVMVVFMADFVPYQGSPYDITRRISTLTPEATNYSLATSVSSPIALINAYLEVQWSLADSATLALNMLFRKFNAEYRTSTMTILDGDLIDESTSEFLGMHNEGLLGSIKMDTVTGSSGRQTIPLGLLKANERIAWDFTEVIGDSPTGFVYEVKIKGIVKDRHWSKASLFWYSNGMMDLTMMDSIF